MKTSGRILGISILTAIYSFAVIAFTSLPANSDLENHHASKQEQYLELISKILFCHTPPAEISINNGNSFPGSYLKKYFENLQTITQSIKHFFDANYRWYTDYSINLLISYQKTKIIFPFQYFW
jgi:hypothetical protein